MKNYADWESHFEDEFNKISAERRHKPGAFLSVVPLGAEWENYKDFVRCGWRIGRITEFPFCLLTLYAGVAFYDYESGDYWKPFAAAVGVKSISPMQYNKLNDYLFYHAREIGLETLASSRGNDFVGTAIFQIGVPLSFWQDFLKVCENLWWREDWKSFSSDEWEAFVTRKVGGLARLKRFLVDNPKTARRFIAEVHDVRRLVASGADVAEIIQMSFLRPEHFAAAPETEQFISPQESLAFLNRFQLVWNENQAKISIYLPPVAAAELPAVWRLGETQQRADLYQHEFPINRHAFQPKISLNFEGTSKTETKKLEGIEHWAIFDDETNRLVNVECANLPLKSYTLVSAAPLEEIALKGFDEEIEENEKLNLRDGFECFINRLSPMERKAQISFVCNGEKHELKFRTKNRVEIFLLAGLACNVAQFRLFRNTLKTDCLPVPCLILPTDLFDGEEIDLAEKFKVSLDAQTGAGNWEKARDEGNQAFYFWRWDDQTRARKKVDLTIESEGLAIRKEFKIEILQPKANLVDCWTNLPDKFLPFALLAQPNFKSDKGTTFDEMHEIKEIVQPHGRFVNLGFFHFYENLGVLKSSGKRWQFAQSKIYFGANNGENFLRFCGNPSLLWQMLRYAAEKLPDENFRKIEVISKKGDVTHLFLKLTEQQKILGEKYVRDNGGNFNLTKVDEKWEENL
ncbi:MAG: hypothetical protein MSG64_14515 [Pyrinomonadaceae bacterium MAG19_C2-C3]|nr:hypothetical protein [Pyrinomonadaceae bacterium MAG19_C2-C3]